VPNLRSNSVDVIDPATLTVIDRFRVGASPQHVVPSWDLRTLWVAGSSRHSSGSLTPIDPTTGRPGRRIDVPDAYNMYFTPDGRLAIVVAESLKRLEFRDPQTMALEAVLPVPECRGINHADFSMDGRYAIFSCEFGGNLVKVDIAEQKVLGTLRLSKRGMPQDVRISPDGKTFYVADMMADGVFLIDGDDFVETGFIPTDIGPMGFFRAETR
jgi:YVTN family beta-propeller protein